MEKSNDNEGAGFGFAFKESTWTAKCIYSLLFKVSLLLSLSRLLYTVSNRNICFDVCVYLLKNQNKCNIFGVETLNQKYIRKRLKG